MSDRLQIAVLAVDLRKLQEQMLDVVDEITRLHRKFSERALAECGESEPTDEQLAEAYKHGYAAGSINEAKKPKRVEVVIDDDFCETITALVDKHRDNSTHFELIHDLREYINGADQ